MARAAAKQEDHLRAFYGRRHPGYMELMFHWHFLEETYRGGRQWFNENIFRYFKEGDGEYAQRLMRAYRFNHTKEVVELVQKYLFKGEISRNTNDAAQVILDFWKSATLNGLNISQFMRQVSVSKSIGGRSAIVVDNNFIPMIVTNADGTESTVVRPLSVAEAKDQNFKIYVYCVGAKDILDYAFDMENGGGLLWIKLREYYRNDTDPLEGNGWMYERVRLWTRTGWQLYEEVPSGEMIWNKATRQREAEMVIKMIDESTHDLGFVPVILTDHTLTTDPYRVPGLIDDIAYLDRAVANYLSNLDAIIQDQTFSQLAIPAQAIQQGDDIYQKVLELGTKRVFVYDAGQGSSGKPEYLSPDPKQAQIILAVVEKIINEIYHTVGLAGERTKQDNSVGIDNSSGVAKAYDFEKVNSLLLSMAQSAEHAENEIVRMVLAWAKEPAVTDKLVSYPTTFDTLGLNDELVTAEALATIAAPIEMRRQQIRQTVDKLFPQLKQDIRTRIDADIDTWLEGTDVLLAPPTKFGGAKQPVASPNRQGEVTKNTPAA